VVKGIKLRASIFKDLDPSTVEDRKVRIAYGGFFVSKETNHSKQFKHSEEELAQLVEDLLAAGYDAIAAGLEGRPASWIQPAKFKGQSTGLYIELANIDQVQIVKHFTATVKGNPVKVTPTSTSRANTIIAEEQYAVKVSN